MVIFETWPDYRGRIPAEIGPELVGIAERAGFSDHMRIDLNLAITSTPPPGFMAVWAADHDPNPAELDAISIFGLGQISTGNDVDLLEIGVVDPLPVSSISDVAAAIEMFDTTFDAQRAVRPERDLVLWGSNHSPPEQAIIERAVERGFVIDRVLFKMGRTLPADAPNTSTRGFDAQRDLEAVLNINNAAFADHPEQGGWTADTFATRAAEPWFDPDGIRLIEVDATVAGFCWVKIHRGSDHDPHIAGEIEGEIYVVAVHPDFAGRGLGKQLVLAGMVWMVGQGATDAFLYVQSDNAAAIAVYDRLGYTVVGERIALAAPARNGTTV